MVAASDHVLSSLPAQFLVLVLLNVLFLGGVLVFLDRQVGARERVLTPLLAACMQQFNHN